MNNKGDNMKEYYTKLLKETFAKWRQRIEAAPPVKGFDPIFKQRIASQYDVIKQRDTVLQQILNEARCFGVKLEFNDPNEEYVSPFDGKAE